MKLLKEYFELQKKIHDYFGYKEDWVVIPLEDATSYYWRLDEDGFGGGEVQYDPEPFEDREGRYSGRIYTQRFLPKWIYRTEEYTMVCTDTQCDGNKFLMVFDNKLEHK